MHLRRGPQCSEDTSRRCTAAAAGRLDLTELDSAAARAGRGAFTSALQGVPGSTSLLGPSTRPGERLGPRQIHLTLDTFCWSRSVRPVAGRDLSPPVSLASSSLVRVRLASGLAL